MRGLTSKVLKTVEAGGLCSGCGACAALAPGSIAMATSAAGFARPVELAPVSADEEARIGAVCPGAGMTLAAKGRKVHPMWGPVVAARKGHALDPELRRNASSGGVLSAILQHLLATGAVDFVVQTGADPQTPYANAAVVSRSAADVFAAAGSRYAPSSPLEDIGVHLSAGRPFAFVGKPCDIAALRAMARSDPRIDALARVMISFFCAGVPSLKGAEAILAALDAAPGEVADFRYRGDGWPGHARATLKSGETRRMSYEDSWGRILTQHLQFRCKICPDGAGGFADIVCADAWECDAKGYPLFAERDGVSLVLTRTKKGEALLTEAEAAGRVRLEEIRLKEIAGMQPGQLKKKRLAWSRLAAQGAMGRPRPRFTGFGLARAAIAAGPFANLKSFLGTCRRIARGRR